ncbi:MAG TPA: ABC transporter permease [Acholeplasmataceae bacterium]|nr:ABC transporter permease [Acholeplasmataceae bacterium]
MDNKFVLANREEIRFDEELTTQPIGYYKDAWNRFKKNKASVVASIIMIFLLLLAIVGPFLRTDKLFNDHIQHAQRLVSEGELPPKIKGLEWLPGFGGVRTVSFSNKEYDYDPLLRDDVVKEFGKIVITPEEKLKFDATGGFTFKVNFYNYVDYKLSNTEFSLHTDELKIIYALDEANASNPDYIPIIKNEGRIIRDENGELMPDTNHRVTVSYFRFLKAVYDYEPAYPFGADQRGRDMFVTLTRGARVSLLIAFSVSAINIVIGVIIGSISGYYGGTVDLVIERISEIIAGIPFIALITLLILRWGSSVFIVIIAFTATGWLGIAGSTRAQFYRYKNREFVLAARTLGASDIRIMSRHILPNAIGTLITSFVLYIPSVIFSESTFSYLGIINYANTTSVGRILSDAQSRLRVDHSLSFLLLFPALFVSLLMLSFNLFGNGLRDAFNPSLRGVDE